MVKKIEITVDFNADVKTVYQAITNNEEFSWRSDLDRIEIISDTQFVEYSKSGIATKMTITTKLVNVQYEFDLDSKNYMGHWYGQFTPTPEGGCRLYMIEYIEIKSRLLKPLSIFMNAKKFQNQYITDLKTYLHEETE